MTVMDVEVTSLLLKFRGGDGTVENIINLQHKCTLGILFFI